MISVLIPYKIHYAMGFVFLRMRAKIIEKPWQLGRMGTANRVVKPCVPPS
jgi:hypothetical protein